jgi:hypothetical protein
MERSVTRKSRRKPLESLKTDSENGAPLSCGGADAPTLYAALAVAPPSPPNRRSAAGPRDRKCAPAGGWALRSSRQLIANICLGAPASQLPWRPRRTLRRPRSVRPSMKDPIAESVSDTG